MEEVAPFSGLVLPPPPSEQSWWDSRCFSGPVVVPPLTDFDQTNPDAPGPFPESDTFSENAPPDSTDVQLAPTRWRMYYYGRDSDSWHKGVKPFGPVPIGRIGLATSGDGATWQRFKGPLPGGAIMDPSNDVDVFDAVQVAVSDAVRLGSKWRMYYLGSGMEEGEVPGMSGTFRGVRMRPGRAESADGVHFERMKEPLLPLGNPGEFDELGVAWPRVFSLGEEGPWLMTYHTRERGTKPELGSDLGVGSDSFSGISSPSYSVGAATSEDGIKWRKHGKVLCRGKPGSWDDGGVSVRHVLKIGDRFVMFYEGSDMKFNFAVGLASSVDGLNWEKDLTVGEEPGGPIFRARQGENVWDNMIVGTPYVVPMADGSFRMYYVGAGKLKNEEVVKQGIGLAVSEGTNYRKWQRYGM